MSASVGYSVHLALSCGLGEVFNVLLVSLFEKGHVLVLTHLSHLEEANISSVCVRSYRYPIYFSATPLV